MGKIKDEFMVTNSGYGCIGMEMMLDQIRAVVQFTRIPVQKDRYLYHEIEVSYAKFYQNSRLIDDPQTILDLTRQLIASIIFGNAYRKAKEVLLGRNYLIKKEV